jgi:hypothetical protein
MLTHTLISATFPAIYNKLENYIVVILLDFTINFSINRIKTIFFKYTTCIRVTINI